MSPRRLPLLGLALALALAGLTGCQGRNRDLEQELLNIKNESKLNLLLLDRQNDFLTNKVDMINQDLETLEEGNHRLSRDFSIYAARPDEVKREVRDEVDLQDERATTAQTEFRIDFTQRLNQRAADIDAKTREALAEDRSTLMGEDRFFRFVFTEQDSLNRVFAQRFESRPWYESILGKWEDQQEKEQVNLKP